MIGNVCQGRPGRRGARPATGLAILDILRDALASGLSLGSNLLKVEQNVEMAGLK